MTYLKLVGIASAAAITIGLAVKFSPPENVGYIVRIILAGALIGGLLWYLSERL